MTTPEQFSDIFRTIFQQITEVVTVQDVEPETRVDLLHAIKELVYSADITNEERTYLFFSCSSLMNNYGKRLDNLELIQIAGTMAREALRGQHFTTSASTISRTRYLKNPISSQHHFREEVENLGNRLSSIAA